MPLLVAWLMRTVVHCVSSALPTLCVFILVFSLVSGVTHHSPQTLIVEFCAGYQTQIHEHRRTNTLVHQSYLKLLSRAKPLAESSWLKFNKAGYAYVACSTFSGLAMHTCHAALSVVWPLFRLYILYARWAHWLIFVGLLAHVFLMPHSYRAACMGLQWS